MEQLERNKIVNALIYPLLFVVIIGLVHLIHFVFEIDFIPYGIYPRSLKGLFGIFSSPLIHGDFKHLFNNSIPLLILGSSLFYFYKKIALKITVWIYLMVGIWTWVYAREAYHIGASGLLYGLFSFLMISGFIRRNTQLISLSFAMIFLYGSLVWGIFPIDVKVSFEGHLWGFIAGIILAIYYRKQGPQKIEYVWDEEEEESEEKDDNYWNDNVKVVEQHPKSKINYVFKPKNDKT